MVDFSNLKKSSGNLDKLKSKVAELNASTEGKSDKDNYWRPEVDKAGNGMATIRFLPAAAVDGEDGLPWAKIFGHGFQGPGGWLIDNCLTTKNQQCPVCEHNSKLWNSGIEANKDIVRKQKRKLNYICNVYIVSDPKHPENEGQVKLFKFGAKIFEKITGAMNPAFEDETPINPFDLWKGANFKLRITKVAGYQNYDKSEFAPPAPLFAGDEGKLEQTYNKLNQLKEFTDAKNYKSYDELKRKLFEVLGEEGQVLSTAESVELDTTASAPRFAATPAASPQRESFKPVEAGSVDEEDTGDTLSYFAKLAKED
jgi:hypothetical protein